MFHSIKKRNPGTPFHTSSFPKIKQRITYYQNILLLNYSKSLTFSITEPPFFSGNYAYI